MKMKEFINEDQEEKNQLKIYTVPSVLEKEIKGTSIITSKISSKPSKEKIINEAFKLHSEGNISEAVKYYKYFIKQGFNDHRVFSNYGGILQSLGKLKEAEISLRKAIEIKPDYVNAYCNLGAILRDLGKLKEAEESVLKAIELNPNFADAYSKLATIFQALGRLKEAETSQLKAIKLNPDQANAHFNLGTILKGLGKLNEAEISMRKAIELKPDLTNAYYNLGNLLRSLGKLKEAEIFQRKAIALNPNFAEAFSNLGNILNDLGNLKEAETCYSKAISLKPDLASALMNRWQIFFDKGEFEMALRDAESCDTQESRACAIETLYSLGRIQEIYERIEKTSILDDKNIRLAAFSSFLSATEKKATAHNFCRNPLSFLHFSNLKMHIENYIEFLGGITQEMYDMESIWEPDNKTTRNGFQTPTHINLFSKSSKRISLLKSIILNELDKYFLKFEKDNCSYIQQWPSNKKLVGWHVILKRQGYQKAHFHPNGWLSGVVYLKVVPSQGKNEGAIELSLNGVNFSKSNAPNLIFQPELGDIILFPSSLYHRTIPFSTNNDRISIAFDLMPN